MKLSRTLLILLIIVAGATAIKAAFFNFKIQKPGDPPPCWSRDQAKKKGVWVCDISVVPSTFELDGRTYQLGEAWIEEAFEDNNYLVWFSRPTKLGWNRLCLRVPRYEDGAIDLDKFKTSYAGSDFQYVMELEVGQYPTIQCQVQFRRWQPAKNIVLGTTVLKMQDQDDKMISQSQGR